MKKIIGYLRNNGEGAQEEQIKPTKLLMSIDISIAIVSILLMGMLVKVFF